MTPGDDLKPLFLGYPVVVPVVVQWGEQDALGHVNNAVYFRWLETSRIAYSAAVGLGHDHAGTGLGPILAAVACDFRRQVTFPDTVHVGTAVTRVGRSSVGMAHRIVGGASGLVVAEATSTFVLFDYRRQRPVPVPDAVRAAVWSLQGDPAGGLNAPGPPST